MRSSATVLLALGIASAALALAIEPAAARPKHHHPRHHHAYISNQPPLTVNKRSWLDPGNVVPVGSESRYMSASTYFVQTPDQAYFPSGFHEDAMPRPLYVPGSMTPLVTFSTPRDLF
ncbi:MAG: hypothetical protein EPN75_09795 [Beijerinckiaceae bacterium]|nr:MAG: hypothetical protein EPN75_09795 [Beijerinckiaceae bacterium]